MEPDPSNFLSFSAKHLSSIDKILDENHRGEPGALITT
jgi:hypothetical protein